uniref:alpha-glucan family phosphorylase n=1 Tax=Cellvibrio fontiphilus TaxID=1815559 RepID=UPI002B4BA6C8|nr:alpha-glucan family phosphorylase [Cellvibrio fontiphilus]
MPNLNRPLPPTLRILNTLAADLWWSWNHAGDVLWHRLNPAVWQNTGNPVSVLQFTSNQHLEQLAADPEFLQLLAQLVAERERYLTEPGWYSQHCIPAPLKTVAYFSMEFGVCDALPLYAGGLGILAGDYLKTASDLGVPLVGIGLLYQEGYFRQSFDNQGWQQQTYLFNDPGSLPLTPLLDSDGSWMDVATNFLCREVLFRVWVAQVGRVKLYLLDSNHPCNQPRDRGITSQLYGGGTELRLVQEIALGIGGWRLLEQLGIEVDICHLNEGHAAFATLERIRAYCAKHRVDFWQALWTTRSGNLFTTHTPVAAGFDRYPAELLRRYAGEIAPEMGVNMDDILALGRANPRDDQEDFNMAYLAMRTCAHSNGVSELHGQVSRRIFQPLFPRWPQREVPVGHITNGVHMPSWASDASNKLWQQSFGDHLWQGDETGLTPNRWKTLSDEQLWQLASSGRARLVDYARLRYQRQWRHESSGASCNLTPPRPLDPNILTLGFARRFAEYKRPDLLLHDPERLAALLCNHRYPVQLLVAGKAHPADKLGKTKLQHWQAFLQRDDVAKHLVFVEDYDLALARRLVQGVDVWINNPRRPWEACGTSGMKVLVNGGLNLSSLDGWWAEAYQPEVGWALGNGEEYGPEHDAADAEQLYALLEQQIIPCFYERDSSDLPRRWLALIRTSMMQLTPRFSTNRMLRDYLERYYIPAAHQYQERSANEGALARELQQWQKHMAQHWHEIHLGKLVIGESAGADNDEGIGEQANQLLAEAQVYLGGIAPGQVMIEVIADPVGGQPAASVQMVLAYPLSGSTNAYHYQAKLPAHRPASDWSLRARAYHPKAQLPAENPLILWAD